MFFFFIQWPWCLSSWGTINYGLALWVLCFYDMSMLTIFSNFSPLIELDSCQHQLHIFVTNIRREIHWCANNDWEKSRFKWGEMKMFEHTTWESWTITCVLNKSSYFLIVNDRVGQCIYFHKDAMKWWRRILIWRMKCPYYHQREDFSLNKFRVANKFAWVEFNWHKELDMSG